MSEAESGNANGNATEIVIEIEIEIGGIHEISGLVAHRLQAEVEHRRATSATEIEMFFYRMLIDPVGGLVTEVHHQPGRQILTLHSACRRSHVEAASCAVVEEVVEPTGHRIEEAADEHPTMTAATAILEVDLKRRDGGESGTNVIEAIGTHLQKQTFGAIPEMIVTESNEI